MEKRLTEDLNVVANSNLEIQLLDGDLNIIQKLDDEPNDVGGLTSAELKAKFDESGNIIKKYINETLIPSVLTDDATEESRKQAEAARVTAEQGRVTAEEGRVSAESGRVSAEQARSEAEASRVSAENARKTAETARADAELTRANRESTRETAETNRANAEAERASAESARASAETSRTSAESARVQAEAARRTAEDGRVQAEATRASAEQSRTSAEAAREAAEKARADETSGIVARATAQANAAESRALEAKSAQSLAESSEINASSSAQTAKSAASTATNAASYANQAAEAASGSASQAQASAAAAAQSAASVDGINKTAQSWAVGGTGTREGEDTNNAKYWAEQAEASVVQPSDTTPKAPGTAAVGTETKYARGDHVHPSDPTKQGINDDLQALRLRGGINSIINSASAVSINPAVNAAGFLRHNGGNVQIFYDGYLMPFSNGDIDKLFDGKSSTYINFGVGPSNANRADVCRWNEATQYPQNARVTYQTASGVFRWYKALKESQGVTPEGDSTGAWEDISTKRSASMMDVRNLEISIVIDSHLTLMWENGASFYWRAAGQNCSYYKIEIYNSVADQYVLVAERDNISRDEVVNTQFMNAIVDGTGKRFRVTFRSQPDQDSGWFAVTQIAFTGLAGGIEGTLLNRGGGTMYGDLSPYTTGGASLGTSSALWQEVRAKNLYGNGSDTTSSFSVASGRSNIASGEQLSTMFGKIAKWFSDLKSLAFKDKVSKSDLDSSVQTMLAAGEVKMRKVTLTVAGWNSSTKQQTVTVSGVLADGTKQKVICSPVDESYDSAWNSCYVQCVGHGADSLAFQCDEIPTAAVEVYVSIQPVSFVS